MTRGELTVIEMASLNLPLSYITCKRRVLFFVILQYTHLPCQFWTQLLIGLIVSCFTALIGFKTLKRRRVLWL